MNDNPRWYVRRGPGFWRPWGLWQRIGFVGSRVWYLKHSCYFTKKAAERALAYASGAAVENES